MNNPRRISSTLPSTQRSMLMLSACVLAACALACGKGNESAPPEAAAKPTALATPEPPAAAPAAVPPMPTKASPEPVGWPKPGWSKVVIDDQVPLCVFSSIVERHNNADELGAVKKQVLRAKTAIAFGVFAPGCVSGACDQLPTIQCSVERDGNALTVRAHYWSYHKDGATCTEACKPVIAGCEAPVLEAGAYTVVYGGKTFPLKIPSVLTDPCLVRD